MDIGSLIGVLIALGCLGFVGYHSSHGHWGMFYSQEGFATVFGGSVSVVFMGLPMSKLKNVGGFLKRFMFNKGRPLGETIQLMMSLSDKVRRDGILSLEPELRAATDPFLKTGLQMAIDGQDTGTIEAALRLEIVAMQERHKAGKKFFDMIKLYGPGWGLVGTLVGQIGMFGQLGGSVEAMGKMLALAVVATMYGTILANAVAGPIGDKLAIRSSEEMLSKELVLQGILSIHNGDNPRITLEKLVGFVPHGARAKLQQAA